MSAVLVAACTIGCAAETPAFPSPTTVPAATSTSPPDIGSAPTTTITVTTSTGPAFEAQVLKIDEADRMAFSWHEGCPVGLDQLRLLRLSFHDFDGRVRTGELIVNVDVASEVVDVFSKLFDAGFPIERMEPIDQYQGDDEASMEADNTSAFNCRYVSGTTIWSEHAYGRAIDINPLLNPWIHGSTIDPPEAQRYADRTLQLPGMIHDGDEVVDAFASIGWVWGGTWSMSKDYQHFSSTGR